MEIAKNTVVVDLSEYIDLFEFKKDILNDKTIIHRSGGLIYEGSDTIIHSNSDEVLRLSENLKKTVDEKNRLEERKNQQEKMIINRNEEIRLLKEMLSELEMNRRKEINEILNLTTSEFKKHRDNKLKEFDQGLFNITLEKKLKEKMQKDYLILC